MTRFLWRVPAGTRRKNKGGDAKKYDDIPRRKTDTAGVREWMRTAAEKAADIIFPPNIYCMACGVPIRPDEPYSLCSRCLQEISWAETDDTNQRSPGPTENCAESAANFWKTGIR